MPRKLDPTLLHAITPPAFDKTKLHRAELVDRIHASLDRSLVVVAAPAGYGKTTILADFTANTDQKVCWARVTPEFRDPLSLARLIVASIARKFPKTDRVAGPRFSYDSTPEGTGRVLSDWIDNVASESLVLILDDVQEIGGEAGGLAFLEELLRLRPASMTLVVSGREVPELSLARLLAQGQLAGFGPNDLALTRKEVTDLTAKMKRGDVDPLYIDRVFEASKGWVTGVVLSGAIARDAVGAIAPDSLHLVYEYLSSVVLNRLPDELRRFCLDVSVLPVMTAEICDRLLHRNDSGRLLRQLVTRGVFIDVGDGETATFSFHGLFRSFLGDTLSASDMPRQTRLRARAAALLEREGSYAAAFQLYSDAHDTLRAGRLADSKARELWLEGRVDLLEIWWRTLDGFGSIVPELALALGTVQMDRGNLAAAEAILMAIENQGIRVSIQQSLRLCNLRAGILFHREALDECISATEIVISSKAAKSRPPTLAVALGTRALAHAVKRTKLPEARRDAELAVELMSRAEDRHGLAKALANLAFVLEAQADYRSLIATVERASSVIRGLGSPNEIAHTLNNLGSARHKAGDFEAALLAFAEGLKNARYAANPVLETYVLLGQADIFNDAGMAMQAAQLYGEALGIAARTENRRLLVYGCLQTAVLYRRRGNLSVANEWMKRAIQHHESGVRNPSLEIQLAVLEVMVAPQNGARSLKRLLRTAQSRLSGEDEVIALTFLARAQAYLGTVDGSNETVKKVLSIAGARGAEQVIAAELAADADARHLFQTAAAGSPVLDIVLGRIGTMESFRRIHVAEPESATGSRTIRVAALGHSQVAYEGKPIRGLKKQAREVLHFLVDRKVASREMLAEIFWPKYPPGRRAANAHTAIHSIRAAVDRSSVLLEDGVYSIAPGIEVIYDVDQFERAAEIAERLSIGDPRRFFALTEAVSLYSGGFLPESGSTWATDRRRNLELRYLDLIAELASEALVRDLPQRALDHLRHGLTIDPLRDDFNIRYLEALGRLGQLSEISMHYQRYARLVRQELGIDPPENIRQLYTRLIG
jgi:LuxR family transcriptional regulator, maltose regulon positive regulatory protein